MTLVEILKALEQCGNSGTKRILMNHGAQEPLFGVKVADLKKIQKHIKSDYKLAIDLYDTGNYDAMYLAGLIADDEKMTKKDLKGWAKKAYGASLSGTTVPSVAAGSRHGEALGIEWIDSKTDAISAIGWTTLANFTSIRPDEDLDISLLKGLLDRVADKIHKAPNETRYAMNQFVICVGCYVQSLKKQAITIGESIGPVEVDMGKTACKIPFAPDYIRKVEQRGTLGKKRKSAKC
jgi:3-methyladenine DNA glycosylase AlkD